MRLFRCLFLLTALFFCHVSLLRAEYKLFDSIEEFGEKRTITAQPSRLKTGPVVIHPFVRSSVTYDDNILRQRKDENDGIVFNVRPGAIVSLPIQQHQMTVGYQGSFENFTKRKLASQNSQNQDFFALADLHFPDWYVNVLEKFSDTDSRSGTTFTDRIARIDNEINPKAGYRWKRFIFESGFHHFIRNFRESAQDNFDFQVTGFDNVVYYDLFARLKTLLEYQFAQIRYMHDFTRSGTINQLRTGLDGELLPNLNFKLRTGFQIRNYNPSAQTDFRSWVGSASLEYLFRPNIKIKASLDREPVEATFQDVNYYTQHIGRLGVDYEFIPRWTLFSEAKYYRHSYAERAIVNAHTGYRKDHHAASTSGLRYSFREYLEFEIGYEFLRRASNFTEFDFKNNQVYFSTLLQY